LPSPFLTILGNHRRRALPTREEYCSGFRSGANRRLRSPAAEALGSLETLSAAIALWRYTTAGVVIEGAVMKAAPATI